MKSLNFPKMFNEGRSGILVQENSHKATAQNLIYLLSSEKGEFAFDPFFGIRLKRYTFEQNNYILRDILIDEIYTQIRAFMPQIMLKRSDITLTTDRGTVYLNVKCTNKADFKTDMYNLVLFQEEEE